MLWHILAGETPIDDISELKIKGISKRQQLNVHEADNIRKATVKYLAKRPTRRTAPFSLSWATRLHREMLGAVWKWAGRFRKLDVNIGVPWQQIEVCLKNLLDDLAFWEKTGVDMMDQAAMLHHRAVQIHPFQGGNGRWTRMLANIWVKQHGRPPTEWPEATIGTESPVRADYLAAIRKADDGDYEPLIALHRRFTPIPSRGPRTK